MQAESSTASAHQAQADAALPLFARGVLSLLTIWPALRLALTHGWAPPPRSSTAGDAEYPPETPLEKRTRMAEELVDAYYSTYTEKNGAKPEITDIEDFLLDFFEFEYGVALEDASELTLAKDLEGCWMECLRRASSTDKTPASSAEEGLLERMDRLAKTATEDDKDPSKALRGTRTGAQDEEDDDSETDEDEEEGHQHAHTSRTNPGMDVDEAPQLQPTPREKEEPIVDEDGFQTVVKKKGGNRH